MILVLYTRTGNSGRVSDIEKDRIESDHRFRLRYLEGSGFLGITDSYAIREVAIQVACLRRVGPKPDTFAVPTVSPEGPDSGKL